MKIYYNDAPDVRVIIIVDDDGMALEHSIPYDDPESDIMTDYIHDFILNGYFADVLRDAEIRDGPADEIIAKYNAIPYIPK